MVREEEGVVHWFLAFSYIRSKVMCSTRKLRKHQTLIYTAACQVQLVNLKSCQWIRGRDFGNYWHLIAEVRIGSISLALVEHSFVNFLLLCETLIFNNNLHVCLTARGRMEQALCKGQDSSSCGWNANKPFKSWVPDISLNFWFGLKWILNVLIYSFFWSWKWKNSLGNFRLLSAMILFTQTLGGLHTCTNIERS